MRRQLCLYGSNDKGKIQIKKIDDNTAENVEIIVHLAPGRSSDKTIDALYAFTSCEVSIAPNCCEPPVPADHEEQAVVHQ